jgi:NAD(P)H-dependent FMN reductase
LRQGSTNTAALLTLAEVVRAEGLAEAEVFAGLGALPHFNPDDDAGSAPAAVAGLRAQVHAAGALLLSTPEYAGALPGSFKNLLDWMIGDAEPGSIYEKPVAWINASARGAPDAHDELRRVLGYAHATIVEPACIEVAVTENMIGPDGLVADPAARHAIAGALRYLAGRIECGRPSTAVSVG